MAILKRIFKGIAISLTAASFCFATEQVAIDHFGYLNINEAPGIIDPTEAQQILNVDVTPGGKSIKKRSGFGSYKTLPTGQAIHGGHHFFDSSGNDVQVWGSSTSLYGIVADGAATQLISSATLNATWDCADTQGFAYCVNSSHNALIKTNGTTKTWYPAPIGTMVAITPERLLVAGVAAAPNSIYYSAASDFTNFTVGNNVPDSSVEQIAAPGSRLTHIEYACGRWLWWKDQSFGYILGTDQTNLSIKILSSQIGTQDNSSAIDPDGNVYFRSQEGRIYQYDCTNLIELTKDISPLIRTSGYRVANSWNVSSVSDFNLGTTSHTTVYSYGVVLSTNNGNIINNSFETGSSGVVGSWTAAGGAGPSSRTTSFPATGTGCTVTAAKSGSWTVFDSEAGAYSFVLSFIDGSTSVLISSVAVPYAANSCTFTQRSLPAAPAKSYVKLKMSSTVGSGTLTSPGFTSSGETLTFWTASDFSTNASGKSDMFIDLISGSTTTISSGTYYSSIKNAPYVASWDTINVTSTNDGGTHSYFVRSATESFTILSTTPTWTAQSSGDVIGVSTGSYFQFRDDFNVTLTTQNPTLQSFTFNWYEGTATDKAYAIYFDDAVWWAVASGDGQATNNYIFKYDTINKGWTLYDIAAAGFLVQNNALYFGYADAGAFGYPGLLFLYGNSYSDYGQSINSYWGSKDYFGSDPWLDNNYTQIDVVARQDDGATLTVGYTVNRTNYYSYGVSLTTTTDNTIRHKKLLPTGRIGGGITLVFQEVSTSAPWEVLGFRVKYDPLPYRPTR